MMPTWSTSLNEVTGEHVKCYGASLNLWEAEDVEEVFADPYRIRTDAYNTAFEKRRAITGQTSCGDIITVIYTVRSETVRPFSVQVKLREVERYKRMRREKK